LVRIAPVSSILLAVDGGQEAAACATEKVREYNLFETAIARTHFINTAFAVIDEIRPGYGEVIGDSACRSDASTSHSVAAMNVLQVVELILN